MNRQLPPTASPLTQSPLIAALLLTLCVVALSYAPHLTDIDEGWYFYIASGRMHEVVAPYSSRFLYPFAAAAIAKTGLIDLPAAFALLATAALFGLSYAIASIFRAMKLPPLLILPAMLTPTLLTSYQCAFLPDLPHAALLAFFFLALCRGWRPMALAVIPLMFWVRESTLLLCLLAFAVMWWDGKRRCAGAIALTTLASMIVSMSVNRHGQPNVHHLPTVVYMALKVPFNFVSNILGIHLWTNNFITPHVWAMDLPRVLQIGTIRKVGISKFVWMPLFTPLMWLSTFGILPTVLLHEWRRGRLRAPEPWMRLALIYGVISYVLGPTLGASVPRLVAYAWPAFWIATVVILLRNELLPRRSAATLFACHMIASWLPWAWQSPVPLAWAVDLVVVIAMHVVAWRTLRATTPAPSDSAASA